MGERIDAKGAALLELGERLDSRGADVNALGERIVTEAAGVQDRAAEIVKLAEERLIPTAERALGLAQPLEGAVDRLGRMVDRLPRGRTVRDQRDPPSSSTTRATCSGSSNVGTWPQPASVTCRAPGKSRSARTACAGGVIRSRSPHAMVSAAAGVNGSAR